MPRAYPIDRLSFSAVREYLSNRWRFHRIYVQKISTWTDSPATLVGKAFHKCLELYYSSPEFRTEQGLQDAKNAGLAIITAAAAQVDWGKTGSLEKSQAEALQTIEHYFLEDPKYQDHGTVTPERMYSGMVKGIPVTVKAISDLTIKGEKELGIVDFKKVSQLSIISDEALAGMQRLFPGVPPAYLIQAWFNYKALFAATGEKADWMKFHEVKTSKNKKNEDGTTSPQSHIITVDFASPEWKNMDRIITKMVKQILRDISRKNCVWLPNISDMMAGEESWTEYLSS